MKLFSLKLGVKFKYCTQVETTLKVSSLIAHATPYETDRADTIFSLWTGRRYL
jgi:hypothetical protein